jgi:lysophospholipase L1-like esterase
VLENSGASAQTGWGTPVGIRGTFNAIAVGISNQDTALPVTGIRLLVTVENPGGTVLADVRQPIFIPSGGTAEVIVRMPQPITSSSNLYVRHHTNGKTGVYRTNPTAVFPLSSGYAQFGWATSNNLDSTSFVQPGGAVQNNGYYRFLNQPFERSSTSGGLVTTAEGLSAAATFTGYGCYAGVPVHSFNSVDLGLSWFRADTRATSFRVILRRASSAGEILAEATVRDVDWTGIPALRPQIIRFDLGRDVTPEPIWMEVVGNGTFSFAKLLNGTYGIEHGATRYSTNSSLRSPNWLNSTSQWNLWARFTRWKTSDIGSGIGETELRNSLSKAVLTATAPKINLPSFLHAISGKEWSLYFDQIFVPTAGRRIEELYDVDISCAIGKQQAERFVIASTEAPAAGTYALSVDLWDRGVLAASGSTSLVVKSSAAGAGIIRKIVFAGDSLTDQGHILAELKRLFAADASLSAVFVGSRSTTTNDSLGVSQTIAHEGYSGKTALFLQSDTTPISGSRFVLDGSGTFNYAAWLTARGATQTAGDWFIIATGTNEVFGASSDAAVRTAFGIYKGAVDDMVAKARAAVAGIRILLITPPGPSGSQDSFADAYKNTQHRVRYKRNAAYFSQLVKEWYDSPSNQAAGLWVAMPGQGWDTQNNARRGVAVAVNEYSPVNAARMNDGVHPGGYGANEGGGAFQIASRIYQFLKGQET